ncbi:2-phospho-L-lactate guanylyltransferase [Amycolatopsis nigrescens]|uniref:2-phospho-L-lactate guanylyltransferase n=1 Tax=Amycolatopsis nigrescens TaxID=381445 RepID=UPI001FDF98CD|nr:2-phospho-L-lactate guanylyltransferase [Amycolatopsis nigrescens]
MKPPKAGKSRLRGAVGSVGRPADDETHAALVLALASDTLAAATAATGIRRVLVVAADPGALDGLRTLGVEIAREPGAGGLNAALRYGERLLRADDPDGVVGALQADLPALRAAELAAALAEADGRRAFTADRQGTGTTLLLSAPGSALEPRFGTGSAAAHLGSGATALSVAAPSLRGDVDTPADLAHARALGLGEHTAALLGSLCLLA